MKRLAIKKLIVISQSESRSLEVPFENGLNIILGGNKTGKSSIIKSIFTTLGCECKRIETDWKKLISAYLLFFKYGEKQFCVVRQGKKFQIFENNEDSYSCIIETETFHEYSNCLMDILEIKMPCISKDGKQFNVMQKVEIPQVQQLMILRMEAFWKHLMPIPKTAQSGCRGSTIQPLDGTSATLPQITAR